VDCGGGSLLSLVCIYSSVEEEACCLWPELVCKQGRETSAGFFVSPLIALSYWTTE
jgi:hypothetical protein